MASDFGLPWRYYVSMRITLVAVLIMAIGCNGVVGSTIRVDKCGECGGNNTTCHIISGIYTRRHLPYGYNKVATVPQGACNINITEMFPTKNHLAIKLSRGAYIFNGNWQYVQSGDYGGAGAVFTYDRPMPDTFLAGKERIFGRGPINDTIDIMLVRQYPNLGIMYEYIIPMEQNKAGTTQVGRPPDTPPDNRPLPLDNTRDKTSVSKLGGTSSDEAEPQTSYSQFNPEFRDPISRYGNSKYSSSLGETAASTIGRTSSQVYPSVDKSGFRVRSEVDEANPDKDDVLSESRRTSGLLTAPDTPIIYSTKPETEARSDVNTATGHRLRHRGRHHGRRHIIEQPPPLYIPPEPSQSVGNLYQALSQGQTSSRYIYGGGRQTQPQRTGYPYNRNFVGPSYPSQSSNSYAGQPYNTQTSYRGSTYQRYPVNSQVGSSYGNAGLNSKVTTSDTRGRAPLNDQIAVSFPQGSSRQISNLDTGSDFSWRISGFTECSQTCGGGLQTTIIVCVKGASLAVVTDENCDNTLKPKRQTVSCNNSPCPAAWEVGSWSECSTSCGAGTQTRSLACKQKVSDEITLSLSRSTCRDSPPEVVRTCNEERLCAEWSIGDWGQCSAECGRGQRSREVFCRSIENRTVPDNKCDGPRPRALEICDRGSCAKTWFHTEWSEQCSPYCGDGLYRRRTYCPPNTDRCSESTRPVETKACRSSIPCGGKWFTGPWQDCSVECGLGVISRDVTCMKWLGSMWVSVSMGNCIASEKPETEQPCTQPMCREQWYMTEWSKCSQSCDTGIQTREIKCLDAMQQVSESCSKERQPHIRQTCNPQPCPTHNTGENCIDKFKNCQLVVQARLCHYSYYQSICCLSCTPRDNGHHGNRGGHDSSTDGNSNRGSSTEKSNDRGNTDSHHENRDSKDTYSSNGSNKHNSSHDNHDNKHKHRGNHDSKENENRKHNRDNYESKERRHKRIDSYEHFGSGETEQFEEDIQAVKESSELQNKDKSVGSF